MQFRIADVVGMGKFRGPITGAINRELNLLRRNGVTGQNLLKTLSRIYHQHNMRDWADYRGREAQGQEVPRIVCSEGME